MNAPWGHKVTAHIYVAGDIADAEEVSYEIANSDFQEHNPKIKFFGISVDEVQDEPKGLGES